MTINSVWLTYDIDQPESLLVSTGMHLQTFPFDCYWRANIILGDGKHDF